MTNKQFAEQAGLYYEDSISDENYDIAIQEFAQLVRDDERAKCAADYLQDCCDAVDAARLEEREACAELATQKAKHIFDQAEIYAVGASETANAQATAWQLKVLADEIRARGNHDTER